jgi:hypothetical protein
MASFAPIPRRTTSMASFAPIPRRPGGVMASFAPISPLPVVSVASFVAFLSIHPSLVPPFWQNWVLRHPSRSAKLPFWQFWLRSRGFHTIDSPRRRATVPR